MNHVNTTRFYWEQQEDNSNGMLLNPDAAVIDELEKQEIIGYLPPLEGAEVLELAAGIGRYTAFFASVADHVTAVDFVEKFIKRNQEINRASSNITYYCRNVMEVNFDTGKFDFIFINWLLMYLEDHEVQLLVQRMYQWIKLNGSLFVRESCFTSSNPDRIHPHTYYRSSNFYLNLFSQHFKLVSHGNISVYEKKYQNPNQLYWLFQKN
ncbi:methyltransferase domain-containing protein [Cyanobacteria bacterium FACHB-DQ100]|nr:methyltransferase domain-containing protein [Cyanobacteria bacterium FACHB-DQ100]